MPRDRPPHLVREVTRHGKPIWYVRVGQGKRVRMRQAYGSPEFWRDYRLAVEGQPLPEAPSGPVTGTLSWLIQRYMSSPEWDQLAATTKRNQRSILGAVDKVSGNEPFRLVSKAAIMAGRDRRRATPAAANEFVKVLGRLFSWAMERDLVATNPTAGVKPLKRENEETGFHAWTEEELARFEARWAVGTRERLAFDLLLYSGLRRGDALKLGRQHVRDGVFTLRTEKTGVVVSAPILEPLAASIEASPTGDLAFLVMQNGEPWGNKESFAFWFRGACRAAGAPGSAHGLRKAGARRAAEAGATEMHLNAVFGWKPGSRESATYTRSADSARLAREAPRHSRPLPPMKESGNA